MTIQEDELFKAAAHGLVVGCTLPVIGYNIMTQNKRNLTVYTVWGLFILFEVYNAVEHLRKAGKV